jgi:hypothetical protein
MNDNANSPKEGGETYGFGKVGYEITKSGGLVPVDRPTLESYSAFMRKEIAWDEKHIPK